MSNQGDPSSEVTETVEEEDSTETGSGGGTGTVRPESVNVAVAEAQVGDEEGGEEASGVALETPPNLEVTVELEAAKGGSDGDGEADAEGDDEFGSENGWLSIDEDESEDDSYIYDQIHREITLDDGNKTDITVRRKKRISRKRLSVVPSGAAIRKASQAISTQLEEISESYFYGEDPNSQPNISEDSGLPEGLLTLRHCMSIELLKRCNMYVLDEKTLIAISGNIVLLLDVEEKTHQYIRSSGGHGIGALTVHPSRQYFATGEKGNFPLINVFEYPSLKLHRKQREGTERAYAFLSFSPDGTILASLGSDPDYMLTLWNWKQEQIMLRSKAFAQDVFKVAFSSDLEGYLTTSGQGHIRFWRVAPTFTGLKLQGDIGRFGKTQISDVEGFIELPDSKVISGTEWGNMLLWDGGLIKVEICRKGGKPCHNGSIQQILMDEGEVMTVGHDGWIRVWDFEAIDTADAAEDAMFELEPMNQLQASPSSQLNCIVKSVVEDSSIWYAQDMSGAILKLDLSFTHTSTDPECIFRCHSGMIGGVAASPNASLFATAGSDGCLTVTDYVSGKLVAISNHYEAATHVIWYPTTIDADGTTIVASYSDGVLRVLKLAPLDADNPYYVKGLKGSECPNELLLVDVLKPHTAPITCMQTNKTHTMLLTGSSDETVFFFRVKSAEELIPMGFVNTNFPVAALQWTPINAFGHERLVIFGNESSILELRAPDETEVDVGQTYLLEGLEERSFHLKSCKSQLRHDEELKRKQLAKEKAFEVEAEKRKKRHKEGDIDDEEFAREEAEAQAAFDEEEEDDFEPYSPEQPSRIAVGFMDDTDMTASFCWLSMNDYDSGYLYKCKLRSSAELALPVAGDPIECVPMSDDVPVTVLKFIDDGNRVLLGYKDGRIKLHLLPNAYSLSTLGAHWSIGMHDCQHGAVTDLAISHDAKTLVSVGEDGCCFIFDLMLKVDMDLEIQEALDKMPALKPLPKDKIVEDIDDPKFYSIEEAKQKAEHDRLVAEAEQKKNSVRRAIELCREEFRQILGTNENIPEHMRIGPEDYEMPVEVLTHIDSEITTQISHVKLEMAFDLECARIARNKLRERFKSMVVTDHIVLHSFLSDGWVESFRLCELASDVAEFERFLEAKAEEAARLAAMKNDMGGSKGIGSIIFFN